MPNDRLLLRTSKFDVLEKSYRTSTGEHVRPVIDHPGAVCILPFLDDGRVVLIRNYRAAVERELVEICAGTLEAGEEPLATAKREIIEETGYAAGQWQHVRDFWMSPGILKERMHFFVARELTPRPQDLDEGEVVEPFLVSWDEALAMTRDGRIEDAKTLVALLYYDRFLRH